MVRLDTRVQVRVTGIAKMIALYRTGVSSYSHYAMVDIRYASSIDSGVYSPHRRACEIELEQRLKEYRCHAV